MPLMVCAMDRRVETTLGYSFFFKKGEPLYVPPAAVPLVMEKGVTPVEGAEEEVAAITAPVLTDKQAEPTDPEARREAIMAAIARLIDDETMQFTPTNKPSPVQLSKEVKFQVSAYERDLAWVAYQEVTAP